MSGKPAVLFVCLGNICRSPLAEAAFKAEAARIGLDVKIDSAGIGGWPAGRETVDERGDRLVIVRGEGRNVDQRRHVRVVPASVMNAPPLGRSR